MDPSLVRIHIHMYAYTYTCTCTHALHYTTLQQYGVDPSLVRIWIGQEDPRELEAKIQMALDAL